MKGSRWHLSVCLLLVVPTFLACATNPATGKKDLVLISESQEIQLGLESAQQVGQSLGLYEDPRLADYVSEIGLRLARGSERPDLPWTIQVVDSSVVNAFALPGGPVYLTRGILAYMENEAAMVGVLGHEIGHITARHSVQQISRSQLAGLGLGLGAVFLPEVRPYGNLIETGLGVLFLKFGRDDEREADRLGVRYALAAGYSPAEMAGVFRILGRLSERSGQAIPTWLSTHPDPTDRAERILADAEARSLPGQELLVREEEFKSHLEGLVFGDDPRQGFADGSRFKHPDLKFQIDFPSGWKVENTRQVVYSAPPDGGAAMHLTVSSVAAGTTPERHAQEFFAAHQLEYGTGETGRVEKFPAYRAPFRARTSAGTLVGEAGFVVDGQTAYEILGYTREGSYRRYRETFLGAIESFSRLRDRNALDAQPLRISLYRVPEAMTLQQALVRSGAEPDLVSELALVNNGSPEDRVEQGSLVKTVGRANRKATGGSRP
jgi:predicted Zn-dependent protease